MGFYFWLSEMHLIVVKLQNIFFLGLTAYTSFV